MTKNQTTSKLGDFCPWKTPVRTPPWGRGGGWYCCARRRACVPSSEHTLENVYKDGHGGNALIAAAFRSPGQVNPRGSSARQPTLLDESVEDCVRKVETSQKRQTRLSSSLHVHRHTHAPTHLSMHTNIHSCTCSHVCTYPHIVML